MSKGGYRLLQMSLFFWGVSIALSGQAFGERARKCLPPPVSYERCSNARIQAEKAGCITTRQAMDLSAANEYPVCVATLLLYTCPCGSPFEEKK